MKVYYLLSLILPFLITCEKESSSFVISHKNDLAKMEIKYLGGTGFSNLGPVTPPDPVDINIRLELINRSITDTVTDLYFENCNVYLITDSCLGEVEIESWYGIKLAPLSVDTITLGKKRATTEIFDPPCRKKIYLTFVIKDRYDNFINFQTDSILYECVY